MRYTTTLSAAGGLLAGVLFIAGAQAQQAVDVDGPVAPPAPAPAAAAAKKAGTTVYLVDQAGTLGTVNLGTHAVQIIGHTGVKLTDLAFSPSHQLYGVSFTALYRIDKTTAHATRVGRLGVNGMNAFVCGASACFGAANNSTNLYKIDLTTGHATVVGSNGKYESAGDLTFFRNVLVLSTTDKHIVALNPATGQVEAAKRDGIKDLFGLVSPNTNEIDGFAFDTAYRYNAALQQITRFSFAGKGLGKTFGAALDGNFGP